MIQKPRAYAEVYNDLDGEIVNFFRVLQDPAMRKQLIELCMLTPYARAEFELAWEPADNMVERARRVAIRAQMGFGSAGATKGTTGFRIDTKRDYGTAQQLWAEYPENIIQVGHRFTGVLIENRPAIEVMQQHDDISTLHFVDPPYVFSTRESRNAGRAYKHEMNDEDHINLLDSLKSLQGFVVLAGYQTDLYNDILIGWQRHETKSRISAGRGSEIRTECVWLNPSCVAALNENVLQQRMFA